MAVGVALANTNRAAERAINPYSSKTKALRLAGDWTLFLPFEMRV
jgi:hypothetical protein